MKKNTLFATALITFVALVGLFPVVSAPGGAPPGPVEPPPATIVTRYPPYDYSDITTKRGGALASGYARIYRAEINKDTGRMYVHMSAQSVIWMSHYTEANFYMANNYPAQSVYVQQGKTLRITIKLIFKGSMRGYGYTGYARLTVKIRIMNYADLCSTTYTVADYVIDKGNTLYPGTQYYLVNYGVPTTGDYAVEVRIHAGCYSRNSGGAWVDFGSGDNYIKLSWIEYKW